LLNIKYWFQMWIRCGSGSYEFTVSFVVAIWNVHGDDDPNMNYN